jgi:hypothetical protein
VLLPFKCGLASKAGLRHLSWNNSGGSATRTPPMEPSRGLWRASRQSLSPSWRELPTSLLAVRLLMKYRALIPIESRLEGG